MGATSTESRAAKLAQGYTQKGFLLSPATQRDLAAIAKREGCTETAAVEIALAVCARAQGEPSNAQLARLVAQRLKTAPEPRK